ncbi:3'-5' exonuclease of ribonuclease D [Fadolivirus algeromassiliense]|jgi:hypothetical protein|uniref:3'-5' exonuclease of ribonuclease D n=1 Tax=Fadolivirus FV1/VV64 TaxID=3070911 RepID=A0A7D3QW42_9VIRU|nr:3'-5' exonuclease of ribonuclease D [Fadolivirus algeromassiliense]QKF94166.1 3'-5' exonuclease of ribonuclease D [Fadolivirus FV1/VV64]
MEDNNIKFINSFYDKPHIIRDNDISNIESILDTFKKEIVENKYKLFVAENDNVKKLFILFLYYYSHLVKQDNKKKHHVGIDLEFNVKEVALIQMNFGKYIWIIDPKKYEDDKLEIIVKKLLLNSKIYKVFHGADSLDLPFIYTNFLKDDKALILKFMRKFIDTRFLCEYVRGSKMEEGKCSIYDAMLYFNTITKEKYDELQKINDSMGPIQDVMWDIKKMSSFHIKYAYYDVLHILDFLNDIYKKILNETPQYVRTYYYIMQVIRFVILERKGITNILEISKNIVNPMNNYLIRTKSGNMTLITIYNQLMEKFIILDEDKGNVDYNFIESLNYIRGTFNFLFRHIVYLTCTKKYRVYKNKTDIFNDNITLDVLYSELEKIRMYKIVKLLKLYESEVNIKLRL